MTEDMHKAADFSAQQGDNTVSEKRKLVKEERPIVLPDGYKPSDDEEFMNPLQTEYFRQKLQNWKQSILDESKETVASLQDASLHLPDMADRASEESDRRLELRTRDRQRKLIGKIDAALRRLNEGNYGYCEMTGEPIGLRRLDARPIATLSIEAQEMHERSEKVHRDD